MKNKISIILIIILAITSCVSIGMVIYQSKNYIKIPKQYRCESEEQKTMSMLTHLFNNSNMLDSIKNQGTYPSDKPDVKIDYIFYRGLKCLQTETIQEIYSDHLPIIAEFEF